MTAEPIPRPLIILGEEFRLMAGELEMRMSEPPFEAGSVFSIFDLVDEHLEILGAQFGAFGDAISNGLGQLTHEIVAWQRVVALRSGARLSQCAVAEQPGFREREVALRFGSVSLY